MTRDTQTNCQNEPAYPEHETVVFSIRYPDFTVHGRSARCPVEHPHAIADCGEFDSPRDKE